MKRSLTFALITALSLAVLSAIGKFAYDGFKHFQTKACLSEMKGNAALLSTAEKNYFAEYHRYTDNFEDAGYVPTGKPRETVFTKTSDIPSEIKTQLRAEEMPSFNEEHFRILFVMRCGKGGAYCFMTIDESGVLKVRGGGSHE